MRASVATWKIDMTHYNLEWAYASGSLGRASCAIPVLLNYMINWGENLKTSIDQINNLKGDIYWNPFYSLRLQMWRQHITLYVNPENLPCVPKMRVIAMQFPKFINGRELFCNNRSKSLWKMGFLMFSRDLLLWLQDHVCICFLIFVNTICLDTYRNSSYCFLSKWHSFAHLIFLFRAAL